MNEFSRCMERKTGRHVVEWDGSMAGLIQDSLLPLNTITYPIRYKYTYTTMSYPAPSQLPPPSHDLPLLAIFTSQAHAKDYRHSDTGQHPDFLHLDSTPDAGCGLFSIRVQPRQNKRPYLTQPLPWKPIMYITPTQSRSLRRV